MCPCRARTSWPRRGVPDLHRLVRKLPETIRWPSGLKATHSTVEVCPCRVRTSWPLAASRSITRSSQSTILVPTARDDPLAVGAERHAGHGVVRVLAASGPPGRSAASHTFTVLSSLPETIRLPSGLNATPIHVAGVPLEREDLLAGGGVPDSHRLVPAPRDDPPAVGAERHAEHTGRCVPRA